MSTFAIGDEVLLPQGHRAILRWIGRIPGRSPIEYAGVEVIGPEAARLGKHSGSYGGVSYFRTAQPSTGLFVSYTQLVSANIKTPRLAPPAAAAAAAATSPIAADAYEASPAFGSPHTMSPRAMSPVRAARASRDFGYGYAQGSPQRSPTLSPRVLQKQLAAGGEGAKDDLGAAMAHRNFYRDALKVTSQKLAELTADYEARMAAAQRDFEQKLGQARRSSTLMGGARGDEVEEQRLALAAMQNKLINERTEKQEEIDTLKRELQHMRKLAGSAEDLEALVGDLAKYDRELTELRTQVNEMDALKEELGKLRARNAQLELSARDTSRPGSAAASPNPSRSSHRELAADAGSPGGSGGHGGSGDGGSEKQAAEVARLERIVEQKLLRESELEDQNERLQRELDALKAASQPTTPEAVPAGAQDAMSPLPAAALPKVPVPLKLAAHEDESSMFIDLAAGRSDWCSLCEREGHSAVDCPFE